MRRGRFFILLWGAGALLLGCQRGADLRSQAESSEEPPGRDPARALDEPPDPRWTVDDERLIAPIWRGNDDKGQLYTPLFRGALPGMEEYVYTPANGDCRAERYAKATIRLDWDAAANTVHYLIKGVRFDPHPTVQRTEGVTWWYNQFHPAPKDFTDGAYRLWTITMSPARPTNHYYDPQTLKLLGTEYDFPQPPPAIAVKFPVFSITGSQQVSPDESGAFSHQYAMPYDHITVEGQGTKPGLFSADWVSFAPHDLCMAAPFQPAISQLRPITSPWQPPGVGPSWRDVLHLGLGFDFHAEERSDPAVLDGNLTYVYSGVSVVSNFPSMKGGVPFGWHASILPAILNVAPPIERVPAGGNALGCAPYMNEVHVTAPRYCELAH